MLLPFCYKNQLNNIHGVMEASKFTKLLLVKLS